MSDSNGFIYDPERHHSREARLDHGTEERPPRPHQRIRGSVQDGEVHSRSILSSTTTRSGPSRPIAPSPAPRRTKSTPRMQPTLDERLQACRRRRQHAQHAATRPGCSCRRASSTGRPRLPMPVASRPPAWRWSQNSIRLNWTREEVDDRLHKIMIAIHKNASTPPTEYGKPGNFVYGANIAGFAEGCRRHAGPRARLAPTTNIYHSTPLGVEQAPPRASFSAVRKLWLVTLLNSSFPGTGGWASLDPLGCACPITDRLGGPLSA